MNALLTILAAAVINIIPTPASLEQGDGVYTLRRNSAFRAETPEAAAVAATVAKDMRASTGYRLPVRGRKGDIVLRLVDGLPKEGYTLEVSDKKVVAEASDPAGLFYALQSLLQLFPAEIESPSKVKMTWQAPCVSIKDAPRFEWRGFHVDPCRHFLSIEDTKRQIDILSKYKVNTMHWHLTDDQGWRIEIDKYPKLQEVAAWRTEFDGSVVGGYYTKDEIRDLVAYAAERFVTVVPEIEMPGHNAAAVHAYPELSCESAGLKDSFYTWGSPEYVLCPGKEDMFVFLEDVVKEVVELFPSEYFHIGGDECMKVRWKVCPDCQKRIGELGLTDDEKGTPEEKLQSYAVHRMEQILAKYGKKLIGWDEILEGGLSPNAAVMSWRGEKGGIKSALAGHYVVMTPSHEGMYLDHFQGDGKIEPVSIGNYTTLEKVYNYDPVPQALKDNGKDGFVKGVQVNTWSEYIYTVEHREYMMFPRALALAEIAWADGSREKDFADFARRIDSDASSRLDFNGVNYHIPLPEQPAGSLDHIVFTDSAVVAFKTTRPEKMFYTLDGTEPSAASAQYEKPLVFTEDALIRICTVLPNGKKSRVRTIDVEKRALAPAVKPEFDGVRMRRLDGKFLTVADIPADAAWYKVDSKGSLRTMSNLEPLIRSMQNVKWYAADAEAYFKVPQDGVYVLSSDCEEVWVDGVKVIDNAGEVKRYSRNDTSLALAAGTHKVKVVFISNVIGGWTSIRNKSDVLIKEMNTEKFRPISIY